MRFRWRLVGHLFAVACAIALVSALLPMLWGQVAVPGQAHPGTNHRDDGFAYCILQFERDRAEASGTGWSTDYPKAGQNFGIRIGELTRVRSTEDQWIVDAGSRELFQCPLVFASDVGVMNLDPGQADNMRRYLQKGGIVWADDFWGSTSWDQWLRELGKFLPAGSRVLTPSPGHPIHRMFFNTSDTLQVSNVGIWSSHGEVSERGKDSPHTQLQVAVDLAGNVLVIMTHNTDIQDTWEQEASNPAYFEAFSPRGYAQGVNALLFAMTH